MRHRVSYVHTAAHAAPIKFANASYVELAPDLFVAREDRYTVAVQPYSHVKAVRIQISRPSLATPPHAAAARQSGVFAYEFQAGVHVYAVPQATVGPHEQAEFYAQLNALLGLVLGVSVAPQEWVRSVDSFYWHAPGAPQPQVAQVPQLPRAWDALDYYYSAAQLTVSTLDADLRALSVAAAGCEYTEVGVFEVLARSSRDDVVLSGARVVMDPTDPDAHAAPVHQTLFHVKPRHRHLAQHAAVDLRANGLHPVLEMARIPDPPRDADVLACKLYGYLTLGKSVFLDPYQVPARLEVVANYGVRDLELPAYAVLQWGNEVLVEMEAGAGDWNLTLHSRYQLPSTTQTHTDVSVDKPVLFYACDVTSDAVLLQNSPFDTRRELGGSFERFFTDDTVFYHLLDRGTSSVRIPNACGSKASVSLATVVALVLGLIVVMLKVCRKWRQPECSCERRDGGLCRCDTALCKRRGPSPHVSSTKKEE
ncbi:PIG-X-domain-containing protein [Metschnikowia bicuspidata var. bicuspidata NRRL YB-4993]|uniref:Protein PBN1 n=1 Tax=Metschnikowia bicuspidata var. bicuspidata NRRL YB-4993 TaxID=869754 RepID=A0A1A0HHP1_9ASCO|nr:PIG-X-domain-containing protein [Metschnikowia bicuspidata var. bicuspidata NRRL YB-4993]OBA23525.1 PIG-X-domain-containing protein [Metschnikowia bicuspidata var. bicuspidata NRRL YB-4993]